MTTYVSNLLTSLFPSKGERARLLCVGLDAAGRTSWLYMKKLGAVVTTIPTVGFNVESMDHGGCEFTIWDVGGCDKIRPLWRHYFQNTDGIVFFVDANDHDRIDEVAEQLQWLMASDELRDAFVLVIANKQDLPAAMNPNTVSERLKLPDALRGHLWTCLPGCLQEPQCLKTHFDWMVNALRHKSGALNPLAVATSRRPSPSGAGNGNGAAATARAAGAGGSGVGTAAGGKPAGAIAGGAGGQQEPDILERWLQVEDEPDEEFLGKLEDFSLQSWDHRTHLRVAWLYLRRHGRRDGLARIHAGIRAFIANSPVTRRKTGTTYHETMTYFWSHMVHYAVECMKVPPGATGDFKLFLLLNPQLTNGGLFLHYYTKKLMLETPEARVQVVLPDKRPLPSIVTDISSLSLKQGNRGPEPPAPAATAATLSDAEFLARFLARTLDKWNHECLLRALYCCLKQHGRQRGGKMALDELRALQKDGFHLTINYFWLCMLTHTLVNEYATALFPAGKGNGQEGAEPAAAKGDAEGLSPHGDVAGQGTGGSSSGRALPEWPVLLGGGGYTAVRMKELVSDEQRFLKHYSKKVIFSGEAETQFVPPDKRPLPSTA